MGVRVREKPKRSDVYWAFIYHDGYRKSKKVGDRTTAEKVAEKIKARLMLREPNVEKITPTCPTFNECAELWLSIQHDWKESTRKSYADNLKNHIYPVFGKTPINRIGRKGLKSFFDKLNAKNLIR